VNIELEEALSVIGGLLFVGLQRLDGVEALGILVLASSADDRDIDAAIPCTRRS
jgi:hypothetical protein